MPTKPSGLAHIADGPPQSALAAWRPRERALAQALAALALALGALQLLNFDDAIDPDGIAYLEMGAAFMRGDWWVAFNSLWSPLYAWLHGAVQWLLKPDVFWTFPTVHLVNFFIYGLALLGFRFFLARLIYWHRAQAASDGNGAPFSESAWLWLGYALFIWTSLKLITIPQESPDLLVSVFVYWALGLAMEIRSGARQWWRFALLGSVLGLAYWAKAFMFAIAPILIGVSVIPLKRPTLRLGFGMIGLATFLLVAAPLIGALSWKYGRLMFSDQGRLTYLMHVNHVPLVHWQGGDTGTGVNVGQPLHPSRLLIETPPVYAFEEPIVGAYPPWLEVDYWYAGLEPVFDPRSHLRQLWESLEIYGMIFGGEAGGVLALFVASALLAGRQRTARRWLQAYTLWIPAATALGAFALVHVEPRYTGAFVTLLLLSLLTTIRLPSSLPDLDRSLAVGLSVILLVATALPLVLTGYEVGRELVRGRNPWPQEMPRVARNLQLLGLSPGDRVAVIGNGFRASAWAWLADLQIVAEVPEIPQNHVMTFWAADISQQAKVLQALASTGARAVLVHDVPASVSDPAWQPLPGTRHFIRWLPGN